MNAKIEEYKRIVESVFAQKRILVIGDIMVDEYITGSVKRISPEAPVPVLDYRSRTLEAGGASNVAHNLNSLGAQVSIVGVASDDEAGKWLRNHFESLLISTRGIFKESGRPTTVKTRYATKGQQLLRVDNEKTGVITEKTQKEILNLLSKEIKSIDAVVLSDYRKGVLDSEELVQSIISVCKKSKVLVCIDSKSRNIAAFKGIDFVKPNNLELEDAVGIKIEDDESLNKAAESYLEKSGANSLVVTRGSMGISVFDTVKGRRDYPAKDVQVYDVCGAGDTVISTISLAMVSGMDIDDAIKLANYAAGVVITKVGTVPVTKVELIESLDEE